MTIKRFGPWLAATCLLGLAGCATTSPAQHRASPGAVPIPTSAVAAELHLPVERYMLTAFQTAELDWIRHAATSACMRGLGFDYPLPARTYSDSTAVGVYSVMARRYGVADPAVAHQWAYELPQPVGDGHGSDPSKAALSAQPHDVQVALLGADPKTRQQVMVINDRPVPEHGCLNAVDAVVAGTRSGGMQGPASNLSGLVTEIKAKSYEQSKADPRVTAAISAWSVCMKDRGYDLTDPMSAPGAVAAGHTASPSSAEIAQADADVACKSSTNLVGIWWAVESDLQNAAIAAHARELQPIKAELDAETADITRLLEADWTTMPAPTAHP